MPKAYRDPRFRYASAGTDPSWGGRETRYGPSFQAGEKGFVDGQQVREPLSHDRLMARSKANGEQYLTTASLRAIRESAMLPVSYPDAAVAGRGVAVLRERPGSLEEFITTTADQVAQIAQEQHDIVYAPPAPEERKKLAELMARPVGSDAFGMSNPLDRKELRASEAAAAAERKRRSGLVGGPHDDRAAALDALMAGIEDQGIKVSRQLADDFLLGIEDLRRDVVDIYSARGDSPETDRAWREALKSLTDELAGNAIAMSREPVRHDYTPQPDAAELSQMSDAAFERHSTLMKQGKSHDQAMLIIRNSI